MSNSVIKVFLSENINITRLNEDLSKADIKDIVEKEVKRLVKKMVQEELTAQLKLNSTQNEIADIAKDLMKKFYKDLSMTSTYVIDRIKV